MKRIEIVKLFNVIESLQKKNEEYSTKFSYGIVINKNKLNTPIEAIRAAAPKEPEEISKFNAEQKEIVSKYSSEGFGKIKRENIERFTNEIEELKKTYAEELEKFGIINQEFNDFLNEEYEEEISLFKIKIEDFPEKIEPTVMEQLLTIISEE